MDYTSAQTSEGNTLSIHTVYSGTGSVCVNVWVCVYGVGGGGLSASLYEVPEWHVLQSEINIQ